MALIETRDLTEIRICTLSRPKANALNAQMVEELIQVVKATENEKAIRALVFESNQIGFFSAGFDVNEVFAYDQPEMRKFFLRFVELYDRLLRLPKPTVGALSGHVVAGGAFLALAFDARVMADGDYRFAVNEINFGAIVPSVVARLLSDVIGPREAARMILTGDSVGPKEALHLGLVDALAPGSDLSRVALERATTLGAKPETAFARNKLALHRDHGHLKEQADDSSTEEFLDQWFSPECVQLRLALAESLRR
jgi:Delta3-Delta2-enoyl-CoA isomerase